MNLKKFSFIAIIGSLIAMSFTAPKAWYHYTDGQFAFQADFPAAPIRNAAPVWGNVEVTQATPGFPSYLIAMSLNPAGFVPADLVNFINLYAARLPAAPAPVVRINPAVIPFAGGQSKDGTIEAGPIKINIKSVIDASNKKGFILVVTKNGAFAPAGDVTKFLSSFRI